MTPKVPVIYTTLISLEFIAMDPDVRAEGNLLYVGDDVFKVLWWDEQSKNLICEKVTP